MDSYNSGCHLDWGKAEPGGWASWSVQGTVRKLCMRFGKLYSIHQCKELHMEGRAPVLLGGVAALQNSYRVNYRCSWLSPIPTSQHLYPPRWLWRDGMAQEHCQSIWLAEHSASHPYKLLCYCLLLAVPFLGLAVLPSQAVLAQPLPWPSTDLLDSAAVSPPPPVSLSLLTHCSGTPSSSSSSSKPHPWETLSGFSPLVPHAVCCLWHIPK